MNRIVFSYFMLLLMCGIPFVAQAQNQNDGSKISELTAGFFDSFERDTLPNGVILTYDEDRMTAHDQKPLKVILYALPNGSTMPLGYGKQAMEGDSFVYESQHIGAQTRYIRRLDTLHTYVIVYVENQLKSWPAWVREQADSDSRGQINQVVRHIMERYRDRQPSLTLSCHSGGGRFIFSYIESQPEIPADIERIVFLDANYGYETALHLSKLQTWLSTGPQYQLQVIAYNDSVVVYNGKPLVSPTGGTWYRSKLMARDLQLKPGKQSGLVNQYLSANGQAEVLLIDNPEGLIYHSVLVERNGFIHSILRGNDLHKNDWFWAGRVYNGFVLKGLPDRDPAARSAGQLIGDWTGMDAPKREQEMEKEILQGNFPDFMRRLARIDLDLRDATGRNRKISYWVMPDYLMAGSDEDFLRLPMRPTTAEHIADRFGFFLSTSKIADDVYRDASVKVEPWPLTEQREAFETFVQHHRLIEGQRQGRAGLIAGIKKDVVITARLFNAPKADRVALYGWHKPDSNPIQPVYTGHIETYVDYSHGIRLVWQYILVDGRFVHFTELLADPLLRPILTNEDDPRYFRYRGEESSILADTLGVLSYNIHHANPPSRPGEIDLQAIAKVIKESGADLVALQEVDVHTRRSGPSLDQAEELGRMLGMYVFFAKAIDFQGGDYGLAILSSYPFVNIENHLLPMSPSVPGEQRAMAMVEIQLPKGQNLLFASTHLDLKPEHRLLQVARVKEILADRKLPVIIAGDFNALPESDVIRQMDVDFSRSHIPNGFTYPNDPPVQEIDFVFFRPEEKLRTIYHQVIPAKYPSDHLPLSVKFIVSP